MTKVLAFTGHGKCSKLVGAAYCNGLSPAGLAMEGAPCGALFAEIRDVSQVPDMLCSCCLLRPQSTVRHTSDMNCNVHFFLPLCGSELKMHLPSQALQWCDYVQWLCGM